MLHLEDVTLSEDALDAFDQAEHLSGLEALVLTSRGQDDYDRAIDRLRQNPQLSSCAILTEPP